MDLQAHPYIVYKSESGDRFVPLVGSNCWTVGRYEDNDVVIPDRWISRHHALLQYMEDGEIYLIDLGSRNGSYVNDRRVTIPVTLQHGDILRFGQISVAFYAPSQVDIDSWNPEQDADPTISTNLNQRRLVSALVVGLNDLPGLKERLEERLLSEVMGTWFRSCTQILQERGSHLEKYVQDTLMAVWFHDNDTISQVDMLQIVSTLQALHTATGEVDRQYTLSGTLQLRVGVNTGYAMVGNTGTDDRPEYAALGNTIDTTFRLEAIARKLAQEIAIGESSYHSLVDDAEGQELFRKHTVHLKNPKTPLILYVTSFEDLLAFIPQN